MNYDQHLSNQVDNHYDTSRTEVRYELEIGDEISTVVLDQDLTESEVDQILKGHGITPRTYNEENINLFEDNGWIIQLTPEVRYLGDFI